MKTRDVRWSKAWSHAAQVVKNHLEVNKISFTQPYNQAGLFVFPSGILAVETIDSKPVYKFNDVEIQFNEIRDAVTLITPTQKDIDELLGSIKDEDLPF